MLKPALFALALVAPGLARAQAPHPAAQIADAERAFAADGLALGIKRSFLKWAQPDAVMIAARPQTVTEVFADAPDLKPGERDNLVWWPLWTGISRSGDLGFSTGPVESNGKRAMHYFTVWKKQAPDAKGGGGWKWIYDGGVGANATAEAAQGAAETHLPVATVGSSSPRIALASVRAAEAAFAAQAAIDQKAAHLKVLADDGRLYVAPLAPAKGKADFARTLDGYPATLTLSPPIDGETSKAGDLVYLYGKAAWARDGQPRTGHYVHVWQKRPGAWKLVFSQIVPAPPPPPAG